MPESILRTRNPRGERVVFGALGIIALSIAFPACSVSRECGGGCRVSVESTTGGDSDELDRWVPLLQSFELRFVGDDRPPALIGVGALRPSPGDDARFYLELRDRDGGDAMRGTGRYYRWSEGEGSRLYFGLPEGSIYGIQQAASRRGCRRSCDLPTPGYDSRENVLVITGFRFQYPDGENNLKSIGLIPMGTTPREPRTFVRATFQDDDGAEPFDVEMSYVLFPTSWTTRGVIAGTDLRFPGSSPYEVPLNPVWRGSIPLLGGFRMTYLAGDEHLKAFGIDATDERVIITFQDNDAAEQLDLAAWYHAFCEAPLDENVHIMECR